VPPSLASGPLSLSVLDDEELDAWYARTRDERKPFARELPIRRSESRRLALDEMRQRIASHAATAFADLRKLTLATAASALTGETRLAQRLKRLGDVSAPLIELREDDLQAQRSMQIDCTLWLESEDAKWVAQLQRRFTGAHVKPAPDALSAHVITRVLHYPGYVLGSIDYYRAQYESASNPEHPGVADLVPAEIAFGPRVHAAYEQLLLAHALGLVRVSEGKLVVSGADAGDAVLGETHLAAAQHLAAPENAATREQLDSALVPRLEATPDLSRELRTLRQSAALTPLDRNILDGLLRKYASIV